MQEREKRRQLYLFRQGQTKRDKELIQLLECKGGWVPLADGWEGCEGSFCLMDWTRKHRIVGLRRRHESAGPLAPLPLLGDGAAKPVCEPQYDYQVRVTNLSECLSVTAQLYRQRADMENTYDEVKNQWGWGGFMTRDLLRCQATARMAALIYYWWSLFVRYAEPKRSREAITSHHAEASRAQRLPTQLSRFLSGLKNTAEQLDSLASWKRIRQRILELFVRPEPVCLNSSV